MSDIHFNCLTVRGSAKGVAAFRKRNEDTGTNEDGKVVHCPLSFNALVPFPEKDLGIPLSGAAESLYHVLHSSDEEMLADGGVRRARLKNRKALAAYFRKKDPEAAGLAEKYRRNIKLYGHPTFLTWFADNWGPNHDLGDGTQWNVFIEQVSPKELVYSFESNWGVPDRWLMTVAKLFPRLCLTLAWEGADSLRTGLIAYRNGRQTTFVDREMWRVSGDDADSPSGSYIRYPEGPPRAAKERIARVATPRPVRKKRPAKRKRVKARR